MILFFSIEKILTGLFGFFTWRIYKGLKSFFTVAAVFLLLSGCSPKEKNHVSDRTLKTCTAYIQTADNRKISLHIEVAVKDEDRQKGLMFRQSMPEDNGMLFVFKKEIPLAFWMKNTYIPLDIAYIGKKYVINEIQQMKPLDTSVTYPSKKPAKYALEMNLRWFEKNKIRPGDMLSLNGCLGQ